MASPAATATASTEEQTATSPPTPHPAVPTPLPSLPPGYQAASSAPVDTDYPGAIPFEKPKQKVSDEDYPGAVPLVDPKLEAQAKAAKEQQRLGLPAGSLPGTGQPHHLGEVKPDPDYPGATEYPPKQSQAEVPTTTEQQPPQKAVPAPTPQGPTTTEQLPQGPVSLEQEDPQTRINNLIASGKSPGEAQAIVAGQEPKTISGQAPKLVKPEEAKAQAEPEAPQVPMEEDPVLKHYREVARQAAQAEAQPTLIQTTQSQKDTTGVADFFRKRGDQPILSENDPRLTSVNIGNQSWRVNKEAAPYFQGFLKELADGGAPIRSDGGWVYRQKVGAKGISEHAFGGAIDVNQVGRNQVTPEFQQWIKTHPGVLQAAEQHWNIYGGERFGDLGHFEWGGIPNKTIATSNAAGALLPKSTAGLNVTHFGYKTDPDLDSESAKGHGKYVQNMIAGYDVALNKAGAAKVGNPKPGAKFTYDGREFRYGDAVPEKYADARFDVYDPNFAGGGKAVAGGGGGGGEAGAGGGGAPTLGGGPMVSVGGGGGGSQQAAQQEQSPFYGGGGRGGGGGATEAAPGAGEFSISYPPSVGGVVVVGGGGTKARRATAPAEEEEEEEDPMVAALMTRGFTRPQALKFALSSRALISAKGVGPLQGQPPAAPTPIQLVTGKPLALPPPAPSTGTPTGISGKPSPEVTLPSKQPQVPARKVPPAAASADKQAVVQALMGMGIKKAQAQQLVANVQGRNVDELLRNALKAHGQGAVRGVEGGSFRPPQQTPPPAPTAPPPKPQGQRITAAPLPTPEPEPELPAKEPTVYTPPTRATPPSLAKLTPGLKLSDAVKEHATLLSEDDPRVKKQADGMIKGEHFVEGDPIHDQLINGLPEGHGGRQHQMLGEAEQAIAEKRPMHISYLSAPKEAQRYPTRESRMVQYDEHSPEARLMGTTVGQMVGHSFIPTAVGIKLPSKAGEPHQSYIQGISTNILANNFQHLNEKLASMGVGTPYKSLGHKFFNDLEGYYSNLNAGHSGTGRGYAIGTEDYPNEPDTSHVPYKLTHKETDFINTVINNTAAFAKHEDAQKLRDLARANGTLITEEGETNRMRHNIEQHEPGWRQRVLEPSIRTFKTGLIVAHHAGEQNMPQTIRPGKEFQDLTRAIQRTNERGRPDVPISVSLHHSFQDNRLINKIERDFSEKRIDEAEARRQLEAMGEDPNEYRFYGGSGGLITPYEEDPESITPEEHTQMRDNLRKQWVSGKLNVEDYRRKAAEVPLPSKPSQSSQAAAPVPKPPSSAPEPPEPEPKEPETEQTPEPKALAPKAESKPEPEAPPPTKPPRAGEAYRPAIESPPPAPGEVPVPTKPTPSTAQGLEKPKWERATEKQRQAYLKQRVAQTLEEQHSDAMPLKPIMDEKGGYSYDPQGNPRFEQPDYNLVNSPLLKKKALGQIEGADDHEDQLAEDEHNHLNFVERRRLSAMRKTSAVKTMGDRIVQNYNQIKDIPEIAAGKGWYSRMREKLQQHLGDDREMFAQLLGATSAKTPVRHNFIQALDAYEQWKRGDFDNHIQKYLEAYDQLQQGGKGALTKYMREKGILGENDPDHKSDAAAMAHWIDHHGILPKQQNGSKYNANSDQVLKVLAGTWLKEVGAPKTPNFAGNLSGRTLQATIDVWAARHLRRLGYEGQTGDEPWRHQPRGEPGVSGLDFAFSQDAMKHAADKIGVNPDDLQAILWYAEKHHWDQQGWTRGEGSKKASFDDVFDKVFSKTGEPMSSNDLRAHYAAEAEKAKRVTKAQEYLTHADPKMRAKLEPYMAKHGLAHEDLRAAVPQEEEGLEEAA
jgi:uncharacterized protein YoaH (UPF0181 family)